uniref:Peptidase M28 domain-containing protein n=1 Tax=Hyaloperonospora arabidopsidis (strain Emoy2) TaxID=559515 RepID=M4BSR0_HYAAE
MDAQSDHEEARVVHDMQQKLLGLPDLPSRGCGDNCSAVVNWIDAQMRGLDRVEVYHQEFQLDAMSAPRTNVYGILRASPLADSKEAIVLVTHYCNVGADRGNSSGLSMGLALLTYLANAKWLAKDVILLAADGKTVLSMEATDLLSEQKRGYKRTIRTLFKAACKMVCPCALVSSVPRLIWKQCRTCVRWRRLEFMQLA